MESAEPNSPLTWNTTGADINWQASLIQPPPRYACHPPERSVSQELTAMGHIPGALLSWVLWLWLMRKPGGRLKAPHVVLIMAVSLHSLSFPKESSFTSPAPRGPTGWQRRPPVASPGRPQQPWCFPQPAPPLYTVPLSNSLPSST